MRNLKRALSLAMASIMVLGMMVVGAGAVSYDDFSDKDKIVNDDAVSMLVELNVINGKDDGSFDPEGIVTRAEMAKMICVVLNGGKDPSLGNVSNYTYTDTVGHWAAAYIEYCTTLGIVAGDGTGKFNPSNTVTGAEAAKMLLVALGFKSEIEGFTGANWAVNVNVRANQKGLFDELSINPSEGLTRDNAAQMVWNALDAGVVSYDYTLITDGSSITSSPTLIDNESKTLLTDKFKVAKVEGVIVANENATSTGTAVEKEDVTVLLLTSDDADSKQDEGDTITLKTATAANLLGKSVTMFAKDWKNGAYQTVLGNPVVSSDNMIATISEDSDADDVKDALKDAGIKEVSKAVLVENYVRNSDKVDGKDVDRTVSGMADVAKLTGNGIEVTVISNDNDNKADFVIVTRMIAGKVSAYNAKGNDGDGYITVTAFPYTDKKTDKVASIAAADRISGAEFADIKGVEDVAKDDIVLYYRVGDTFYMEKAESVNITVTSTKGDDQIKDGSDTYKASALSAKFNDDNADTLAGAMDLDDEVTLYLDNFGYVVYTDAVTAADEYMYITGSNASTKSGFESLTIKGVLSDGTEVTATVNKLGSKKLSSAFEGLSGTTAEKEEAAQKLVNNKIVTYTKTGEQYNITVKDNTKITQIEKNKASLGGATANSKTIFVIGDKSDNYKVYTGISNVPDVTSSSLYCYAKSGVAKFVVALNATTSDGDTNGVYILGKTASAVKSGDDTIYVVEAYVNDEYVAELELDGYAKVDGKLPAITRGYYAGVSTSGGNTVDWDDIKNATPDAGSAVTDFGDGIISSETTSALTYDKDTIVIIVDGTKHVEGGDIDEIVYVEDDTDASSKVVLVEGTGSDEGHADYVFIIR
ncbi:S-layer homology domain-containing protein [Intestinimonas butyriciproducens]|uniref:S-layer homology domain-containing protein n=3 Tax=Intestinimonas butyriciproducens TaxID=1297617 RepID=UPI0034A4F916